MLVGRQAKQAFEQMKGALTEAVMKGVGDKIIAISNEEQKKNKELIFQRIKEFEQNMRTTAREIVKEEMKDENRKAE